MKEDTSIYLKVDCVEPVYKNGGFGVEETYLDGVKVWIGGEGHFFECDSFTICDPDEVREDGRRQVMDLAIDLIDTSTAVKQDLFGAVTVRDIFLKFPYDAIKEKIDAWKKEKETIRVRDEVININNAFKMVVTVPPEMGSNSVRYMSGIGKEGTVYKDVVASSYKKTGLHVDDLDSYLVV